MARNSFIDIRVDAHSHLVSHTAAFFSFSLTSWQHWRLLKQVSWRTDRRNQVSRSDFPIKMEGRSMFRLRTMQWQLPRTSAVLARRLFVRPSANKRSPFLSTFCPTFGATAVCTSPRTDSAQMFPSVRFYASSPRSFKATFVLRLEYNTPFPSTPIPRYSRGMAESEMKLWLEYAKGPRRYAITKSSYARWPGEWKGPAACFFNFHGPKRSNKWNVYHSCKEPFTMGRNSRTNECGVRFTKRCLVNEFARLHSCYLFGK